MTNELNARLQKIEADAHEKVVSNWRKHPETDPAVFAFGYLTSTISYDTFPIREELQAFVDGLRMGVGKTRIISVAKSLYPGAKPIPCEFKENGRRCPFWAMTDDMMQRHIISQHGKSLIPLCPECRQGKHGNCNGDSWNPNTDKRVKCPCTDISHSIEIDESLKNFNSVAKVVDNGNYPAVTDDPASSRFGEAGE